MSDLAVGAIDVTPLAVAICHRLHLMNDNPLPCRACITKVMKALPVVASLLREARVQAAGEIAQAIEAEGAEGDRDEGDDFHRSVHFATCAQIARSAK